MKIYQKILSTGGAIFTSVGLLGCADKLEGIVKEEFGTGQSLVESSGTISGNIVANYGLVLVNEQGGYIIKVRDYPSIPSIEVARAIELGDRVRIVLGGSTKIGDDKVVAVDSFNIQIVEKAKK